MDGEPVVEDFCLMGDVQIFGGVSTRILLPSNSTDLTVFGKRVCPHLQPLEQSFVEAQHGGDTFHQGPLQNHNIDN